MKIVVNVTIFQCENVTISCGGFRDAKRRCGVYKGCGFCAINEPQCVADVSGEVVLALDFDAEIWGENEAGIDGFFGTWHFESFDFGCFTSGNKIYDLFIC